MNIEKILDEQEIVPVFQPIVSLKNCDILGYEICSHLNDKPITEYFEKAEEFEKIWKLEKLCRKSILKKVLFRRKQGRTHFLYFHTRSVPLFLHTRSVPNL